MELTLTQHRTISGLVMLAAVAIIGLFIYMNRNKAVAVVRPFQPIGNTGATFSNSMAAPNPAAPQQTSWAESGIGGDNTGDAQSIYGD